MAASKKEKTMIEVKHLSKQYNIGVDGTYKTFCDSFTSAVRHPLKMLKDRQKPNDTFWALKDVNFEVEKGEVVGIIGRNGAGKSTLLKVLSRITYPSKGEIRMRGRVGSLLEVGTGFHPELTGRENIYFNGAILGMKKKEIEEKFEEIVKFSDVEKFLDTPVKRYSSGMQVRLAFSVAANLDPEILVVDEVLAVGDVAFQKKCIGKMEEVSESGKTVLFVSHNMAAIETLCSKVMLMEKGTNSSIGNTEKMISKYFETVNNNLDLPIQNRDDRLGRGNILIKDINVLGGTGLKTIRVGENINIYVKIQNFYSVDTKIRISISIRTLNETGLISCDSIIKGETYMIPGSSESILICKLFSPPLNKGEYYINAAVYVNDESEDWITSAVKLDIEDGKFEDHKICVPFPIITKFEWELEAGTK